MQKRNETAGRGFVEARAAGAYMPGFAREPLRESVLRHQSASFDSKASSLNMEPPASPIERSNSQQLFTPPPSVVKNLADFHISSPNQPSPPTVDLRTPESSESPAAHATLPDTQKDSPAPHAGEPGTMEAQTIPASQVELQEGQTPAPATEPTHGHESTQERKDETTASPKANAQPILEQQNQAATPPATAEPLATTEASPPGQQLVPVEPAASKPSADQPKAPKEAVTTAEPTAPQQPTPDQDSEKSPEPTEPTPKECPKDKAIEKAANLPPVTKDSKKEMYENGTYWKYLGTICSFDHFFVGATK